MVESGLVLHRGYTRRELDSCPVSVGEVSPSTRKTREASFLEHASTFTLAGWSAVGITFKAQSLPRSLPDGCRCMDDVSFHHDSMGGFSQNPELVSRGVGVMG